MDLRLFYFHVTIYRIAKTLQKDLQEMFYLFNCIIYFTLANYSKRAKTSLQNDAIKDFGCGKYKFEEESLFTIPVDNYMFKVNHRNAGTSSEICSKLTIKIPEQHFSQDWIISFFFILYMMIVDHDI